MRVSEIFFSIQGESTYAGLPCIFIRLAGCNLRCRWCDTTYAQTSEQGEDFSIEQIIREVKKFNCKLVEITGGEPMSQKETPALINKLLKRGYEALLETNGSIGLKSVDARVIKIVDVKCPSSGYDGSFLMENLNFIALQDEIKFVIADRKDYEFARDFLERCIKDKISKILFAPVYPAMPAQELAKWILADGLKVRLQPQMHKFIWGEEKGR
ncbi:MAG: radical SAM protein [Deltaproteobacteria bacterium]|nr:radical SAM protein [Deltaproteobacteria bacterium]